MGDPMINGHGQSIGRIFNRLSQFFQFVVIEQQSQITTVQLADDLLKLAGSFSGRITINIAKTESDQREATRIEMGEPYRTLIGHFRHEIGHYYCDRLIKPDADRLAAVRAIFGDESGDYSAALETYYKNGRHQSGRTGLSVHTPAPSHGRIGRRPGRTIFTSPTPWRPPRHSASAFSHP
jgi:hypothetical protein